MSHPATVLLVDQAPVFREGLKQVALSEGRYTPVGDTDDEREALSLAITTPPDLAVLDLPVPDGSRLRLARHLLELSPGTRLLFVVRLGRGEPQPGLTRSLRQALEAGALGLIGRDASPLEFQHALQRVAQRERYLDPRLPRDLFSAAPPARPRDEAAVSEEDLTRREREVLAMLTMGLFSREIASRLGISAKTVEHYRGRLMRKLGCRNSREVVAWAHRNGLDDGDLAGPGLTAIQ